MVLSPALKLKHNVDCANYQKLPVFRLRVEVLCKVYFSSSS